MKIVGIEIIPLRIPFKPQYVHGEGDYLKSEAIENIIIKVNTDEGITGLGEDSYPESGRIAQAKMDQISKVVLGRDPYELQEIHREMRRLGRWDPSAFNGSRSAIDMALYDIIGKDQGLPLYKLIGGKSRTQLEDHRTIFPGVIQKRVEQALEYKEAGFTLLEVKSTVNIRKSFDEFKVIMDALGDGVTVIGDANAGWNDAKQIIHETKKIEHYEFALEQPLPPTDLDGLARITQSVEVPVVLDESVTSPEMVMQAVRKGAGDIINIKEQRLGGITDALKIVAIAEAAGLPLYIGEGHETGLSETASAHLALHIGNLKWSGFFTHLYLENDIVKSGGVVLKGKYAEISDMPGIGVELDEALLKRYRLI